MKTNYKILDAFLDIQRDTMFSESKPLGFARITYSPSEPNPFWNYGLVDKPLDISKVALIEKILVSLKRKPMLYFENRPELVPLINLLTKRGYTFHNEDSWMFYESSSSIDETSFLPVKRVETEADLNTWTDTIDRCYVSGDSQNPYGKLETYLDLARMAWIANNSVGKFEYYLAFKGNEPVAVATLTIHRGLGYISNVGSLQSVRGQGFGKLVTMRCVHRAKQMNCKEVFLGTEEGTYPNEFYKRLGFKTRFTAIGYVKNN